MRLSVGTQIEQIEQIRKIEQIEQIRKIAQEADMTVTARERIQSDILTRYMIGGTSSNKRALYGFVSS